MCAVEAGGAAQPQPLAVTGQPLPGITAQSAGTTTTGAHLGGAIQQMHAALSNLRRVVQEAGKQQQQGSSGVTLSAEDLASLHT